MVLAERNFYAPNKFDGGKKQTGEKPVLTLLEGGKDNKELKKEALTIADQIRQKIEAGEKVEFNNSSPEFTVWKDTLLQMESSRRLAEAEKELGSLEKEAEQFKNIEYAYLPSSQLTFEEKMKALDNEFNIPKKKSEVSGLKDKEAKVIEIAFEYEDILEHAALPTSQLTFEEKMRALELKTKIEKRKKEIKEASGEKEVAAKECEVAKEAVAAEKTTGEQSADKDTKKELVRAKKELMSQMSMVEKQLDEETNKLILLNRSLASSFRKWLMFSFLHKTRVEVKKKKIDVRVQNLMAQVNALHKAISAVEVALK
ncbi:MAG TPA: hypothetical protein VMX18_00740 [Candidatus Bipolaricaulota bacterium]|nr:hypothetical protein [Candidatus Bipolaricaulota bacterium]